MKKRILLVMAVFLSQLLFAEGRKPSVILIMADDMGYECIGANGCVSYKTPNLNRMATEGVRFTHCYSQPICSPSRVQIMTGIYNNKNYTQWGNLPGKEVTFGHVMQQAGYATACAGKWQLSNDGVTASKAGFDETCMWAYGFDLPDFELKYPKGTENNYYYNPADPSERYDCVDAKSPHMTSRYWRPCILRNGKLIKTTFDDYGPDICTEFLLDYIDRNQSKPFFIYYPMILTHGPNVPTPATKGAEQLTPAQKLKSNTKYFKDMVEYADTLVGRILDKLETLGLRDNTIIMFTGDNGTMHGMETETEDGIVVGGKGSTPNAGTHVPLITSWRGTGVTGKTCDDLIDFTDFLMTIAHAGGAELPTVKFDESAIELDGHSFLPQICGEKGNPRQYMVGHREWVFCHWDKNPASPMPNPKFPRARFARDKRFKLYDNGRLYDVENDELEQNIIPPNPENSEAERARKELQKVLDSMYMKPDFYTQGGVTRKDNLSGYTTRKDAVAAKKKNKKKKAPKTAAGISAVEIEAQILALKKQRKQFEKKSEGWNKFTDQIKSLQQQLK